ncbi:hypothetical protein [Dactylosporangium darangshiense]|uniref:hypothetical protein n=1 Tax=Dactylosporangium darangshiense TaxID=579108 RepID=UPI00362D2C16
MLAAFGAPHPIPQALVDLTRFDRVLDPPGQPLTQARIDRLIGELSLSGLVTPIERVPAELPEDGQAGQAPPAIAVHMLVAQVIAEQTPPGRAEPAWGVAVDAVDDYTNGDPEDPAEWPQWRPVPPIHDALLARWNAGGYAVDERLSTLMGVGAATARFLGESGNGQAAIALLGRADELLEERGEQTDDLQAGLRIAWALIVLDGGATADEVRACRELLDGVTEVLGDTDLTLQLRVKVAQASALNGMDAEAEADWRTLVRLAEMSPSAEAEVGLTARLGLATALTVGDDPQRGIDALEALLTEQIDRKGADSGAVRAVRYTLGLLLCDTGQGERGLELLHAVLDDERRLLGPDHPDALTTEVAIETASARLHGADADRLRPLLNRIERTLGSEHQHTNLVRLQLVGALNERGDMAAAAAELPALQRSLSGVLPGNPLGVLGAMASLSSPDGPFTEHAERLGAAIDRAGWEANPDHPMRAMLDIVMAGFGAVEEAEAVERRLRELLEKERRLVGPRAPLVMQAWSALISLLSARRDPSARDECRRFLDTFGADHGLEHPVLRAIRYQYALVLAQNGRAAQAVGHALAVFAWEAEHLGPAANDTLVTRRALVQQFVDARDYPAALGHNRQLIAALRDSGRDDPADVLKLRAHATELRRFTGERDATGTGADLRALAGEAAAALGAGHEVTLDIRSQAAHLREIAGEPGAEAELHGVLLDQVAALGPESAEADTTRLRLARMRLRAGDHDGAAQVAGELFAGLAARHGVDSAEAADSGTIRMLALHGAARLGELTRAYRDGDGELTAAGIRALSTHVTWLYRLDRLTAARAAGEVAEAEAAAAVATAGPGGPPDLPGVLGALRWQLAIVLQRLGDLVGAERFCRGFLTAGNGAAPAWARHALGAVLVDQGRGDEARAALEALERDLMASADPADAGMLPATRDLMAHAAQAAGNFAGARAAYSAMLAASLERPGAGDEDATPGDYGPAGLRFRLGQVHRTAFDLDPARRELETVLAEQLRQFGPRHPASLGTRAALAELLLAELRDPEAAAELAGILADWSINGTVFGFGLWHALVLRAAAEARAGDLDAARRTLDEVRAAALPEIGDMHPLMLQLDRQRAYVTAMAGSPRDAEALLLEVVGRARATGGGSSAGAVETAMHLAAVRLDGGDAAPARREAEEAREWLRIRFGAGHPLTLFAAVTAAAAARRLGDLDAAERELRDVLMHLSGGRPTRTDLGAAARLNLALVRRARGVPGAQAEVDAALAEKRARWGTDHPETRLAERQAALNPDESRVAEANEPNGASMFEGVDIAGVATSAATSAITAMALDTWGWAKQQLARLLGGGDPEAERRTEDALERSRARILDAAPGRELDLESGKLAGNFEARLEDRPALVAALRELVADLDRRNAAGTAVTVVNQHVVNSGDGVLNNTGTGNITSTVTNWADRPPRG